MIRILKVQGEVFVDDRKHGYMQPAQTGMVLQSDGDYLVATDRTSTIRVEVNGKFIDVPPASALRICPDGRTWNQRHGLARGGAIRSWLGRIWFALGGGEHTLGGDGPDGGGGIRG
jgi:hypothetical protein